MMKAVNVTEELAERLKQLQKIEKIQEVPIPFFSDEMLDTKKKEDDGTVEEASKK